MIEVGASDLAMDRDEARLLLGAAGLHVTETEIGDLHARTEGWPAGLYLAALAMNAGSRGVGVREVFSGDDRFMGDYLRSEFLRHVSRADVTFLARTSILDRLTGPLCDAVVGGSGSYPYPRPFRETQPVGCAARPPGRVVSLSQSVSAGLARRTHSART